MEGIKACYYLPTEMWYEILVKEDWLWENLNYFSFYTFREGCSLCHSLRVLWAWPICVVTKHKRLNTNINKSICYGQSNSPSNLCVVKSRYGRIRKKHLTLTLISTVFETNYSKSQIYTWENARKFIYRV